MAPGLEAPRRADIVVAVHGSADPGEALRTGRRVSRQLGAAYRGRPAVVLLLSASEPTTMPAEGAAGDHAPIVPWARPGQNALEATLRAAAKPAARPRQTL